MPFALVTPDHPFRGAAEACAREAFKRAYDAKLLEFPRLLVVSRSVAGKVEAVAGIRTAGTEFFSEQYLPARVETVISGISNQVVDRRRIIEFTTLASERPAAVLALFDSLGSLAMHWGFEWAFFTATVRLRHLLRIRNIPLIELARADPARLVKADDWGSYYGTAPAVCAIQSPVFAAAARLPGYDRGVSQLVA